jgi:hypothetical protein
MTVYDPLTHSLELLSLRQDLNYDYDSLHKRISLYDGHLPVELQVELDIKISDIYNYICSTYFTERALIYKSSIIKHQLNAYYGSETLMRNKIACQILLNVMYIKQ